MRLLPLAWFAHSWGMAQGSMPCLCLAACFAICLASKFAHSFWFTSFWDHERCLQKGLGTKESDKRPVGSSGVRHKSSDLAKGLLATIWPSSFGMPAAGRSCVSLGPQSGWSGWVRFEGTLFCLCVLKGNQRENNRFLGVPLKTLHPCFVLLYEVLLRRV